MKMACHCLMHRRGTQIITSKTDLLISLNVFVLSRSIGDFCASFCNSNDINLTYNSCLESVSACWISGTILKYITKHVTYRESSPMAIRHMKPTKLRAVWGVSVYPSVIAIANTTFVPIFTIFW